MRPSENGQDMPNAIINISHSPEETRTLARALARTLRPGDVLAFSGDLGSGKTCFISGLAQGLGISRSVHSPTFTLINEYTGSIPLYHMDLYRLSGPEEARGIDVDAYLDGAGVTAIEWAERIASILPERTIHIRMVAGTGDGDRLITIERPAP